MRIRKDFQELQIKDDFMFSIVMGDPKYCKPFLERVLGFEIFHIEYLKSQEAINLAVPAKSVRLDIFVEDNEGSVYNIEMQTVQEKDLPERIRYYQGAVDLNILKKGEKYGKLKRSYVIFVCTFDFFNQGRHIYTFENRCIQDLELPLGDGATKIILNTKGTADDVTLEMKRLLDYIDGKAPEDSFTKELDKAVQSARKNEEWGKDYMYLEYHFMKERQEGREEGREETAMGMIEDGIMPLEKIAKYTKLSLERVCELKKRVESKETSSTMSSFQIR